MLPWYSDLLQGSFLMTFSFVGRFKGTAFPSPERGILVHRAQSAPELGLQLKAIPSKHDMSYIN